MKYRSAALWLALASVFTLFWATLQGCNDGGEWATPPTAVTPSPQPAANTEPTPAPTAEEPEDASGGRVLWAKISQTTPWTADFFNDTFHNGTVSYCVYDISGGFASQGSPIWAKKIVVPSGTTYGTMPVDIFDVAPSDWCGHLTFQVDLIRGESCGTAPDGHAGYQFPQGAAFGALDVTCECKPHEWEPVGEPIVVSTGEWARCNQPSADYDAQCYECHTVTYEQQYSNGCSTKTETSTEIESRPVACPQRKLCYYRVSCGDQGFTASCGHGCPKECTLQQQQEICERAIGLGGDHGIWRNFGDANLQNHCQFEPPGYANNDFQLNPGQSSPTCVNKKSF